MQADLFDWDAARQSREAAMGRADDHADADWKDAALAAVYAAALERQTLTSEHVLPLIDKRYTTHDLRALGPVLVRAAKLGWIEKTGQYQPSARRHMSPLTLWESLLYGRASQ